jgi:hypothetical protein
LVSTTAKRSTCKASKGATDCHSRPSANAAGGDAAGKSADACTYQWCSASKEAQQISCTPCFLGSFTLFGGWTLYVDLGE